MRTITIIVRGHNDFIVTTAYKQERTHNGRPPQPLHMDSFCFESLSEAMGFVKGYCRGDSD